MPDNAIRVEKIDRNLVLQDQDGGSVGETLSVAYAFLATLFNRADHQLPFIVDSPANPIDLRVRSKVAELIPRLTNQFIAFTISSERDGFLTPLEHATVKDGIQYLTLFRKGTDDLAKLASGEASVQESSDGICVTGAKIFPFSPRRPRINQCSHSELEKTLKSGSSQSKRASPPTLPISRFTTFA